MSFQYPGTSLPVSQNPQPNVYPATLVARETADIPVAFSSHEHERAARRITRRVLDAFWDDMEACSSSAILYGLTGTAGDGAARNRERIARDREVDEAWLRRARAA